MQVIELLVLVEGDTENHELSDSVAVALHKAVANADTVGSMMTTRPPDANDRATFGALMDDTAEARAFRFIEFIDMHDHDLILRAWSVLRPDDELPVSEAEQGYGMYEWVTGC